MKKIIDIKVIKKIIYTVGACLDKKEKPSRIGIKNQNIFFFSKIAKIKMYKDIKHNIKV